jgi:hypothetical protein
MTAILLTQQYIHFWGASSARPGNLQFNHAEEIRVEKKGGNLHNVRICNGRELQPPLKNESGVLAVECSKHNCNPNQPGNAPDAFTYTIDVMVPKNTTDPGSTNPNGGVNILVEISSCQDPNVTVSETSSATTVSISGVTAGTTLKAFNI